MKVFQRLTLLAVALALSIPAEPAFPCDSCYWRVVLERHGEDSYIESQCCTSGTYHCENMAQDGWNLEFTDRQWCSSFWEQGYGYRCSGSGACDIGGVGGGGGAGGYEDSECTVGPADFCPTSCARCTRIYY